MILIFGGTSETHELCDFLLKHRILFHLSVATEYGRNTFEKYADHMQVSRLDEQGILTLIEEIQASQIIDLTHPYAANISQNAISAAQKSDIPYIRYERTSLLEEDEFLIEASSHEEALKIAESIGYRPFLAVGSNFAGVYIRSKKFSKAYIRVLPKSEIIKKCEDLGYDYSCIIAMQGPFSKDLNVQMLKLTEADMMITKESGNAGGFMEKYLACKEMGIPLIVVERPKIHYPNCYDKLDEIKARLIADKKAGEEA